MKHRANADFWRIYNALPMDIRDLADRAFALLKANAAHPSLHFNRVGALWFARINLNYRALAIASDDGFEWVWIGTNDRYDRKIS